MCVLPSDQASSGIVKETENIVGFIQKSEKSSLIMYVNVANIPTRWGTALLRCVGLIWGLGSDKRAVIFLQSWEGGGDR